MAALDVEALDALLNDDVFAAVHNDCSGDAGEGDWHRWFTLLDTNGGGRLDLAELTTAV